MDNKIVVVDPLKSLIKPAPGFQKKELAEYKLDILALCGFGCRYCSSNMGNYLRIHKNEFADASFSQTGKRLTPTDDPSLMFVWPDVVKQLENELEHMPQSFGEDKTLMFSMLTDGFSPYLVENNITRRVLELILDETSFRIRVLTKNAVVGNSEWVQFFSEHCDRFVVGLSTGSLDESWCRRMELGTSSPKERFKALWNLQDAGVPTFGMLCPVFPDMLEDESIETMIDMLNPDVVKDIWAEPFNDRINWRLVRDSYPVGSKTYDWFTRVYEYRQTWDWSSYATELYTRIRKQAKADFWISKLKYLLYEDLITPVDATAFRGLEGVLLQSKPEESGMSKNPAFAAIQK